MLLIENSSTTIYNVHSIINKYFVSLEYVIQNKRKTYVFTNNKNDHHSRFKIINDRLILDSISRFSFL